MEPQASHETQPQSNQNLQSRKSDSVGVFLLVVFALLVLSCYWTVDTYSTRESAASSKARVPLWSIDAPAREFAKAFVRIQDTSYWTAQSKGVLTSPTIVATQASAITLTHAQNKSRLVLAPGSVALVRKSGIVISSGMALVGGANGKDATVVVAKTGSGENETFATLEPHIGSVHDMQLSEKINFTWPSNLSAANLTLEFARDAEFKSVLFAQKIAAENSASISFGDRSPGPWFSRLKSDSKVLAYSAFNLVESQTPDQLRRLGRRWLTWRDRALASVYRLEFSPDETFKNIAQSFQVLNREFDLAHVPAGRYFTRVVSVSVDGQEFTSRPLQIEVQDKSEILRAGLELSEPELKLYARGWKIVLARDEVSRIREGFVILHESELRGVKVSDEIFKGLPRTEYEKRASILKSVIFELSRDESFANPERVRPDAHGELLPPALPLGILFARLRRIESDGTLGAMGPASRLTTWLPAPVPRKTKIPMAADATDVELKWDLETEVAGFELRLSPNREFTETATVVLQSRAPIRKISTETLKDFFWTVTAVNEFGQKVSMTSEIQEVHAAKQIERKIKPLVMRDLASNRDTAAVALVPALQFPLEDAVVVGGATAKKYGKLKWDFPSAKSFEVQVATDRDFVNVIEKATTLKPEFTLQGDLPEGSLFWRVRKSKAKEWSESRKFELVYE